MVPSRMPDEAFFGHEKRHSPHFSLCAVPSETLKLWAPMPTPDVTLFPTFYGLPMNVLEALHVNDGP